MSNYKYDSLREKHEAEGGDRKGEIIENTHDELRIVKQGAAWYVVDEEGKILSPKGYHEITVKDGNRFTGKLGAREEEFTIL